MHIHSVPLLYTLTLLSCFGITAAAQGADAPAASAATSATAPEQPVADKPFVDFAVRIVESLNNDDPLLLDNSLDREAILRKICTGFSLSDDTTAKIRQLMRERLNFGSQLVQGEQSKTTHRLMRCTPAAGGALALIRILGEDGGVNWLEFSLLKNPDGSVGYNDVYIALNGSLLSDRFKQLLYPLLVAENAGVLEKIFSSRTALDAYLSALQTIQNATKLDQDGKSKEAFALYCTLPSAQRYDFQFQVIAHTFASRLGTESPEYNQLLGEIYTHSRSNPGAQLLLIDYFFNKKEYAKMRESLRAAQQRFGPDAYIYYLTGASFFFEESYAAAIENYRLGRAIEPDMAELYDQESACYTRIRNFTAMKNLWLDFQEAYPGRPVDQIFRESPDAFQEFMMRPEFPQLLKEAAAIRARAGK